MVYYIVIIKNYDLINDKINKMKFYKKYGIFFQRKGIKASEITTFENFFFLWGHMLTNCIV